MRERLIKAGIRNLKEFGYPQVNADNILTDEVYSAFFASMLKDNLGKGWDKEVNSLLEEIEQSKVELS